MGLQGCRTPKDRRAKRHDIILWYAKQDKKHCFNPDPIRREYATATKERFKHKIGNVRKGRDYGGQTLNSLGKHPDDVISDIQLIAPSAKERTGYPTQKPVPLLDDVIESASKEGDIILDPFCGCGTTLLSSRELKRQWMGIDISRTACDVMASRLGGSVRVVGCESPKELQNMNPHDFARLVIVEKMHGTVNPRLSGDMGIDGWVELRTACAGQTLEA